MLEMFLAGSRIVLIGYKRHETRDKELPELQTEFRNRAGRFFVLRQNKGATTDLVSRLPLAETPLFYERANVL